MFYIASRLTPWIMVLLLLSSCASKHSSQSNVSYDETKTMVIDILNSPDGQKAIKQSSTKDGELSGLHMQLLATQEGQQIQLAVKEVLTDPNYPKHLEKMMTDPKFAGEFAKAIQKQNRQLQKELLKDPEYQTLMIDMMKHAEFTKMLVEATKSPEYRQQSMTIMQDSLENPLFRLELMKLMKKVLEEETKKPEDSKEKEKKTEQGAKGK